MKIVDFYIALFEILSKRCIFKVTRMGPFSGDFQRGGDSERHIHYFSALYLGPCACINARIVSWITTVLNEWDELHR